MDPVTASFIGALGVALIGALGTWYWNRHKPQVDRNATTVDGFDKFAQRLNDSNQRLNEDNKYLHAELRDLRKRVTTVETSLDAEKKHSRAQDGRIGTLQRAVESWTTWGKWLHTEWATIRLNEAPPDLPTTEE